MLKAERWPRRRNRNESRQKLWRSASTRGQCFGNEERSQSASGDALQTQFPVDSTLVELQRSARRYSPTPPVTMTRGVPPRLRGDDVRLHRSDEWARSPAAPAPRTRPAGGGPVSRG